jgi:hypothetical protein
MTIIFVPAFGEGKKESDFGQHSAFKTSTRVGQGNQRRDCHGQSRFTKRAALQWKNWNRTNLPSHG